MSDTEKTLIPVGRSRRDFLKGSAATLATTALLTSVRAAFPGGAFAAGAAPETTKAILGYIALTDAAPLIVAKEKGFFKKYGVPDVDVQKQASWGTTRDNLELGGGAGGIDGAHILTPMPYLMTAGKITKTPGGVPMSILSRLNTQGQGIMLANAHKDLKIGLDTSALKERFAGLKAGGKDVKVAMTFPGGTHDCWIRYWLAAGGIDPDKDCQTIVVPPAQMVANAKVGAMEAYCVGEPWPLQTVNQGVGYCAITTGELWKNHPEKSFAMRSDFVEKNPIATKAILAAVLEAAQWADKDENKDEMCAILAKREWFKVPVEDILDRSKGKFDLGLRSFENKDLMQKYWRDDASYPFQSHDLWFLTEDIRWGYLPATTDTKALIAKVNREDLWREAAKEIGVAAIPASTSRGVETFFDGVKFDPANPTAYLDGLKIKKLVG
ncbi:CmpA/NrtA family ABC transporter substrate-binding protein [Methyloraptor flagellatus]|uniref:CmpA/NrtA family ABC transporter substrate-binding protein n=1 Tax=Methyloraptor flagellatus TaxID=3162530 RepID=A0AAU7X8B5_9HYPH